MATDKVVSGGRSQRCENIWWRSLIRMLLVRCKSSKEANQIMAPFLRSSKKRYTTEGETSVIHKLLKSDALAVIRGLAGEYADAALAVMGTRGNGRASQYKALAIILSSYLADERPQGVREEEAASFIRHHRTVNRMVEGPGFREALGHRPWPPTVKQSQVAKKAEPSPIIESGAAALPWPPTVKQQVKAEPSFVEGATLGCWPSTVKQQVKAEPLFIESATLISPATSMESSPSSCTYISSNLGTGREYDSELEDTACKPGPRSCCASATSALVDDFGSSLVFKEMQRLARNDSFNELDTSVMECLDDYTDFEQYF